MMNIVVLIDRQSGAKEMLEQARLSSSGTDNQAIAGLLGVHGKCGEGKD